VGTITVKENTAGSLNDVTAGGTSLKLTLPPGFSWVTSGISNGTSAAALGSSTFPSTYTYFWGDKNLLTDIANKISTSNDGRELDISSDLGYMGSTPADYSSTATGVTNGSNSSTYFEFSPSISVNESTATTGPIVVTVGGSASANVSTLTLGTYGQFGVTATAQSAPTIAAGQCGDAIGELEVSEGVPDSLIAGRTITLTLPSGAVWAEYPTIDTTLSTNYGNLSVQSEMEGTNGNIMQVTINGSTSASQSAGANLFLKNLEVNTAMDFSGPLTVTLGGSQGLTGTVTLGTVAAPVTMAAASAATVSMGQASQALGNITITEAAAGNLNAVTDWSAIDTNTLDEGEGDNYGLCLDGTATNPADLYILAPEGVTFDTTPTVTVSSGNLQLGTVTTETSDSYLDVNNQGVIVIPIQASSTTASTITISGITVTIDNTVPEGPVVLKLEGPALNQNTNTDLSGTVEAIGSLTAGNEQAPFPNSDVAATATVGTITNGISNSNSSNGTAVFTIGQTSYTLNGTSVTMDVAPYIENSRTYLPLRYVANALGVNDDNILWDPTSQKVTIIKGSIVAQFTVGSTTMLLNGASVTMDTAPEITDGRTCLPVAWVAQALGAQIAWDATAQTATITF
jgi:hypothetical protein